jgi:hypothetical protein
MGFDLKYGQVTLENHPESMGEDEPVIVFRAQDKLVVPLLARYENLYVATQPDGFDADADPFVNAVREQRARFHEWQQANPDKTKLPD